jgi:hypothetical protein
MRLGPRRRSSAPDPRTLHHNAPSGRRPLTTTAEGGTRSQARTPAGRRMLRGRRCGPVQTASPIRAHFAVVANAMRLALRASTSPGTRARRLPDARHADSRVTFGAVKRQAAPSKLSLRCPRECLKTQSTFYHPISSFYHPITRNGAVKTRAPPLPPLHPPVMPNSLFLRLLARRFHLPSRLKRRLIEVDKRPPVHAKRMKTQNLPSGSKRSNA